jgi:hypothetical protein
LREIYEIGIVFRGFVIVSNIFKKHPSQKESDVIQDLSAAFISAISSFAQTAFTNNSLEYLESGNILFIFKMSEVKSGDNNSDFKEPIIMYGLTEKKKKKNPDKFVKKFLDKLNPILENFIQKYNNADFTELTQFKSYKDEIKRYFV